MATVSHILDRAERLVRRGKAAAAKPLFLGVLSRYPKNRRAVQGLARLVMTDPAAKSLQQADVDAILVLMRSGHTDTALMQVTALLSLFPSHRTLLDIRASCLHLSGRFEAALQAYRSLATTVPRDPAVQHNLGVVLRDMTRLTAAEHHLARAAELAPGKADFWLHLAMCRSDMARYTGALEALEKAQALRPEDPGVLNARAVALRELGQLDAAEAVHRRVIETHPDNADAWNHLGILFNARGDDEAARRAYQQAMRHAPTRGDVHLNLSAITRYSAADGHMAQMRAALASAPAAEDRTALQFALSKALRDLGQTSEAMELLHKANARRRALIGYDLRHDAALMTHLRRLDYGPGPGAEAATARVTPIFIVGLPRSGTTLTEQILTSHPDVAAGGERHVLAHAASDLLHRMKADGRTALTAADAAALRARVLTDLTAIAGGAGYATDKMPLNFRWLGMIRTALPEARIVHVTRDHMATCWSLYQRNFSSRGNGFAYDLGDLAGFVGLYSELMAYWRAQFGNAITQMDYDAMTAAPEPSIRALVSACGLDWNDACLAPHLSRRAVLTASAGQVRKAIYGGSSQAWKRYASDLAPLIDALQPRTAIPLQAAAGA